MVVLRAWPEVHGGDLASVNGSTAAQLSGGSASPAMGWHGERRGSSTEPGRCSCARRESEKEDGGVRSMERSTPTRRAHFGERFLRKGSFPWLTEASTGCARWRRSCWRDGAVDGERWWPGEPTPPKHGVGGGGGERVRALWLCCGWRSGEASGERGAVEQVKASAWSGEGHRGATHMPLPAFGGHAAAVA